MKLLISILSTGWHIISPHLFWIALFTVTAAVWWGFVYRVYSGLRESAEEDEWRHNSAVARSRKELEEDIW